MSLSTAHISDRRAHDRHPIRTAAVLTLPGGHLSPARSLDIGKGGAGVVCDLNVPVGTVVQIRMSLPARPVGSALFESQATVKSSTLASSDGGFRLGLEFGPLSLAATAALKGLL